VSAACGHRDDAGAYVLGALEDAEATAYAAHLRGCEGCRDEVARLQVAADALGVGVPQMPAPPALKARIMDVVEREAELLRAAGPEADRPPTPAPAPAAPRRGLLARLPMRPALAAALAAGILVLGGAGGFLLSRNDGGVPVTRTVQASVHGNGRAALELTGDHAALKVDGVPSLPEGRVYQVWFVRRGARAPEPTHTLFNVRRDGRATVSIDEPVRGVRQVLVTAEPDGGSMQPTSAPIISATA
jgi:anti-sigma factor RsiW